MLAIELAELQLAWVRGLHEPAVAFMHRTPDSCIQYGERQ